MRIYIIDEKTEADVYIYGTDGSDCTEKFFTLHFIGKGVKLFTDEEKEKYNTSAYCGIYGECFDTLAKIIEDLQAAIDRIAEDMEQSGCDPTEVYTFDDRCYAI